MITRPTTDVLILDCCRELTDAILPALTDETLRLRLVMTETVLRNAAVRAAHENRLDARRDVRPDGLRRAGGRLGTKASRCGPRSPPPRRVRPDSLHLADVADRYERAGQAFAKALAVAQEAGAADLVAQARELLRARIATEKEVMATYTVVGH